MKQRILLIVAVLLIATPAFATVKIDVTQGTGADVNKLTVSYKCTGTPTPEKVRAFALNFSLGSAGNSMTFSASPNDINDFNRGESNKPGGGYGIFPGQFRNRIDPGNPNWLNLYYTPIAPDNDVDSNGTGLGNRTIIAELGTLYKKDGFDTNAPGASGILFTIRVDANGKDSNVLTVSANTIRGGIVLEDGTTATDTNLPFTKTIKLVSDCFYVGKVDGKGHVVTAAEVATWVAKGKPACWCYKCHPRGDVDNSCTITSVDVLAARNAWPNAPINGVYNPCADVDYSGTITSVDILAVRNAWPNAPINGPGCTGLTGGCP